MCLYHLQINIIKITKAFPVPCASGACRIRLVDDIHVTEPYFSPAYWKSSFIRSGSTLSANNQPVSVICCIQYLCIHQQSIQNFLYTLGFQDVSVCGLMIHDPRALAQCCLKLSPYYLLLWVIWPNMAWKQTSKTAPCIIVTIIFILVIILYF